MFHIVHTYMRRYMYSTYGPRREKTSLRGLVNNTGADQPEHPRSLISAFVIHFFEKYHM